MKSSTALIVSPPVNFESHNIVMTRGDGDFRDLSCATARPGSVPNLLLEMLSLSKMEVLLIVDYRLVGLLLLGYET